MTNVEPLYIQTFNGEGKLIPTLVNGLTKREYFAVMAMQGLLTAIQGDSQQVAHWNHNGLAIYAIQMADALIAELNKVAV